MAIFAKKIPPLAFNAPVERVPLEFCNGGVVKKY